MLIKFVRPVMIMIMVVSMTACANSPTSQPTASQPQAPNPEVGQEVAEKLPANTPVPPTATTEPTITSTATLVPSPTPDKKATEAAIAKAKAEALTADIKTELEKLGLPTEGKLAWVSDKKESIDLTKYGELRSVTVADTQEFKNFILKVDVSWTSQSGLAGCGIIFRSATPNPNKSDHYDFETMRLSGAPAWAFGYFDAATGRTKRIGDIKFNKLIDITNGATNTYYLVARGDEISVYSKGKRMGVVSYSKLSNGSLAWLAFHESGETNCTFDNAWVWELP